MFMVIGIYLPFLPAWLEGRGLSPGQVAMVFAVAMWAQLPIGLIAAILSETTGQRKLVIGVINVCALLGLVSFQLLEGYLALLLGWLIAGALFTSSIPLIDSMATLPAHARKFDYSRVRLWGSVGFIFASAVGGMYLQGRGSESVLSLLIVAATLLVVSTFALPNPRSPALTSRHPTALLLLRDPRFAIFIFTTAFLQSSHAGLYGFATIRWLDAEISEQTVGLLWAEGVFAEVLLFTLGRRLIKRFSVTQIFLVAALAGMVRWLVLGATTELVYLVMVQALHALTFAATHLAAVLYISRNIDSNKSATAQQLYSGMAMGMMFGVAMIVAGQAYVIAEGYAFLAMAGFSALGGMGALSLRKLSARD